MVEGVVYSDSFLGIRADIFFDIKQLSFGIGFGEVILESSYGIVLMLGPIQICLGYEPSDYP